MKRIPIVLCALLAVASNGVAADFSIAAFGAKSDGSLCTMAFADAVGRCAASGGGRVCVPAGTWFTGPIHLKSHVELHLEKGATILFTDDPKAYLPVVRSSWEGLECLNLSPLVYAYACTNVAITGSGTLRAKMDFWRQQMNERETDIQGARAILYKWGSEDYPVEKRDIVKAHPAVLRPQLIQFNRCVDVCLEGVRVEDSPFWTIHLFLCDGVTVRGLDVCAHGFNNDGIDLEMTQNVLIENSTFDQGDDGIVFKAGRNRDGWRLGRPTKNVEVRNCHLKSGHSLAGIGSELSGGIENVHVHDCTVDWAARLFFVKTNHRRGGYVRNIRVENIVTRRISRLFVLDVDVLYQWRQMPDYETRLTEIDGLTLRNIMCEGADAGIDLVGDPRLPPKNITIENVHIGSITGVVRRISHVAALRQNDITVGDLAADTPGVVTQTNPRLQTVTYARPSAAPIVYSAEVKATAAGGAKDLCLWLDVHYADGSAHWGTGDARKDCADGTYSWRKVTGCFKPAKPVKKIEFSALFRGETQGTVEFRNMKIERRAAKPGEVSSEVFWTDFPYSGEPQTVPGIRDDASEVWTADSMTLVTPLTFPSSNRSKMIDLELCGREHESAQVCVTTGRENPWTDGMIEIGELKRSDGRAFPGTAKWERIGYVPREVGGIRHSRSAPMSEKWLPDPLLPAAPFKVRAGSTQGVWLTFYAEPNAEPGVYTGEIRVCRGKTVDTRLAVKITVRNVTLPKTFSRNVSLSVMDGFTRLKYPNDFKAKKRASWDVMLDHRLSPDDISRFTLPDLDDLAYAKSRGMNRFNILNIVPEPKDPNTPIVYTTTKEVLFSDWFYPKFRDRLVPYVAELRKRGLADMAYIYGFDEQKKEFFPAIEMFWKKLQKDVPGIPLMSTAQSYKEISSNPTNPPPGALAGDWYCPASYDYRADVSAKLRAQGKKCWWYTYCAPQEPYLNFASIEYPAVDGRLLGWQTHLVGADGYLFWIVNYWSEKQKLMDESDTFFPDWSMKIGNNVYGDGILLYPGKDHVLPSIRLANIRDGVEDSELMLMSGDCLEIVKKVTTDVKHCTREPRVIRAARSAICDLIEGLGKDLDLTSAFNDPASFLAAKELRTYLKDVAGKIALRRNASFPAQAWQVIAEDGALVITARDGLGALYGAYNFLERLGYRFFAPDCTVAPKNLTKAWMRFVPSKGRVTILEGTPAIKSRYVYLQGGQEVDAMWALRNRGTYSNAGLANTEMSGSPRDNHTMEFYAEMIRREGEARSRGFCLMDDGVRHRVAEAMKTMIRQDRAIFAGKPDYEVPKIYELSQNDGGNDFPCKCEKCLAAKKAAGSWSGPNIRFASAVADEVAREFPDVKVRTFAYSYTEKAPEDGFTASSNLIIRYCRSFVFQPLTADTPNGQRLADWDACVNEKYVWGYWRSYSGPIFPLVKPRADIEREFRFCRDRKVRGYFAEAENPYDRAFSFLQAYLALKLMENPDLNAEKMSRAFLKAYYGKAAEPMTAYLAYLERREKEEYAKIDPEFLKSINSGYLAMFTERGYLDEAFFATVDGYLAQAERAAVGDANVLARIARERRIFEAAKADRYAWRPEAIGQNGSERGHPQLIVKDPDARLGYAVCDAKGKVTGDFTITLMDDWTGKTSEFRLNPNEIPWNRWYRLYKVGTIHLVCESWIGFNGGAFYNWVPYFGPKTEPRDVWVSMRFKDGNVYYDGLWFVPVGDGNPEPQKVTEKINLLENGDLSRHWYKFLQGTLARDVDPKGVFTAEGSTVRVSGEDMGCITTKAAYRDYVLDLDFRYVDHPKQRNKKEAYDGGLLYHSTGVDGAHGIGIWMACFEYNIIQGASGDMLAVSGDRCLRARDYRYKAKVDRATKGTLNQHWDPNGVEIAISGYGRVRRHDVDLNWQNLASQPLSPNEKPFGEWNHVRLVCRGNTSEHYFNGLKVGEYTDLDPAGGRIQLQSEGFGIEYRNIVLTPLD